MEVAVQGLDKKIPGYAGYFFKHFKQLIISILILLISRNNFYFKRKNITSVANK